MKPNPNLPPVAALRVFEAAARHEHFTRAADELCMTQAAVSYQIKALESRLGVQLFSRQPGGVALTAAGKQFAVEVIAAFERLRDATRQLVAQDRNHLRVCAVATFAATWLEQRLLSFRAAHPELEAQLVSMHRSDTAMPSEFDFGVSTVPAQDPALKSVPLFSARLTAVCSAHLLAEHPLRDPADLLSYPLLGQFDPWWRHWFDAAGVDVDAQPPAHSNIASGTLYLEVLAAAASKGAVLVPIELYREELRSGLLVQPFPICSEPDRQYWLTYSPGRLALEKMRVFRDWILAQASEFRSV